MTSTIEAEFSKAEIARGEALFKGGCSFVKGVVKIEMACLPTASRKSASLGAPMLASLA